MTGRRDGIRERGRPLPISLRRRRVRQARRPARPRRLPEGAARGRHTRRLETRPSGPRSASPGQHVHDPTKAGVGFKVLNGQGADIDTTSPQRQAGLRHKRALRIISVLRRTAKRRIRTGLDPRASARGDCTCQTAGSVSRTQKITIHGADRRTASPCAGWHEKKAPLAREFGISRETLYQYLRSAR